MPNSGSKNHIIHKLREASNIEVLAECSGELWPDIYIYSARMKPLQFTSSGATSMLISLVLQGDIQAHWKAEGQCKDVTLSSGTIAIIPPNLAFEAEFHTCAEIINIYVSQKILRDILFDFRLAYRFNLAQMRSVSITDKVLEVTMHSIKELLGKGGALGKIEIEYLVCAMVARIISRYSTEQEELVAAQNGLMPDVLRQTLEYIDQNLQGRITTERLARMAGLGSAQFARLFKRTMYTTLHQYIISCRIKRAREMLTETNIAIVDIAQDCGFADQVHLTRLFGRMTGTTPALFRKKTRDCLGEGDDCLS